MNPYGVVRLLRRLTPLPLALALSILTAGHAARGAEAAKDDAAAQDRVAWFRDAKFGMFIHWGLYSIPAGVWNGRDVPGIGEWIMDRARIPIPEYEPLAKQFNPTKFNAEEWVRVAHDAGMRYLVITAKHHDGFCMFKSELTDYNVVAATPWAKDPMRELIAACRKSNLKFGFFYSILDWHRPDQKKDFAMYNDYMTEHLGELLNNYGTIDVLWFDGSWIRPWNLALGKQLYDYCLRHQPNVLINDRVGKQTTEIGDFDTVEQTLPPEGVKMPVWELCLTMNDTWGYKTKDVAWKSPKELIRRLIEVVSKGGNLLLNVGPTAEGVIPEASVRILGEIGQWMKVNGESIYGTTACPWRTYPYQGYATIKGKTLYLHVFEWPEKGLEVPDLKSEVISVRALDPSIKLGPYETSNQAEGYTLRIPKPDKLDPVATVIAIDLKESIHPPSDAIKPPQPSEKF